MSRPVTLVELDMPRCVHSYGVYPCEAILSAPLSCFNTRATCQDVVNFLSAVQTYRFADTAIGLPPEVGAIPCIVPGSINIAPTKLTPMKGLGTRASVTITFVDFAHHDRVFDPYVASRTYSPEDQGTFWGKFRARHKYYQGRKLRVRIGSIESPWNWNTFSDRTYIIDRITGPDANGKVTITAKDVLKLIDGDKAKCPIASTSTATGSLTSSGTSLTLSPSGIGTSEYAVREQSAGSGAIRIGSEIMTYTRSGDVLTLTRGQWGTTAVAHSAGDAVQLCAKWSSVNAVTLIKQLLGPLYANVDQSNDITSDSPGYLTDASWAAEAAGNASIYLATCIISKPEGIDKLVSELCEQCMLNIWWDEVAQLIKVKTIAPDLSVTTITDDTNIIMGSFNSSDDPKQRVSQVWTYYGKVDFSGDDKPENYRNLYINADLTLEGSDLYGEQKIKTITSRWFNSSAPIVKTAYRTLVFLRDNPRVVKFSLDAKDRSLDISQFITLTSRGIQDSKGSPQQIGMMITERAENGGEIEYSAVNMAFYGRYARVIPGGSVDSDGIHVPSTYTGTVADYSTATDAEKAAYGYIIAGGSNASGMHVPVSPSALFSDGGEQYKAA